MKTTKLIAALFLVSSAFLTSCSKDDETTTTTKSSGTAVTENITSNTTWTKNNTYILKGRIAVEDGATLTIEAGTVIKGDAGTGANATALLVARGGKLMAVGTAAEPIIFTSTADNIKSGEISSPNMDPTINGLWGGVILCGKAKISASNDQGDVTEVQIEGIPTSDPNGLYGGNDDADNSGVIKYVSIRHGGTNIGSGNEINGLTLGGVGSGTVIENIEIVANQDDGIEWFGGAVNVSNVVVYNAGDDAIDTDQSWGGTLTNVYIITPGDRPFELDGPEGTYEASHNITQGTILASDDDITSGDLINVDGNTPVSLNQLHFTQIVGNQMINKTGSDAASVTYTDITLDVVADSLANYVSVPGGESIPSGITAGGSAQANTAVFSGWTWSSVSGAIK